MTPDQIAVVTETWRRVVPVADQAVAAFYDRLFEANPGLRGLFRHTDLAEQRRKLANMLDAAVAGLDDLDTLVPVVEALGRRHAGYGVTSTHYEAVGDALLWTLERGLGPAWTPAAAEAWSTAYAMLADVMQTAAEADPSFEGRARPRPS